MNIDIKDNLFALADDKYKTFQSSLIPNVEKERIIGVRTPDVRKLAKDLIKSNAHDKFISELPHFYHEENILHAFIIMHIKEFDDCIEKVNSFLPYIDNWATCDSLRPKVFCSNRAALLGEIKCWLCSDHEYTVRYAIEMLMLHFLDCDFSTDFLEWVSHVSTEKYYVHMMVSWYFATALAKQWEHTLPYIIHKKLDSATHNKAIQKAVESRLIANERKQLLKKLKY